MFIRQHDPLDQLHHFCTVYMVVIGAVVLGVTGLSAPLDCWYVDPDSKLFVLKHYVDHINRYCWSHHIYKFPDHPRNVSVELQSPVVHGVTPSYLTEERSSSQNVTYHHHAMEEISVYRFVTAIFIFQAIWFKVPHWAWLKIKEVSGSPIDKFVTLIRSKSFNTVHVGHKHKNAAFDSFAEFFERWLILNRTPKWILYTSRHSSVGKRSKQLLQHCMLCMGATKGNYLSTGFLLVKFGFLFMALMMYLILSAFLGFDFWTYGPEAVVGGIWNRVDYSGHFPRCGLCYFQMRGSEGQWLQCLLSLNMILEVIFIVEWFWLTLLVAATAYSLTRWCIKIMSTEDRISFVKHYLNLEDLHQYDDTCANMSSKTYVSLFVTDYLGNDGVFLLRILVGNTNDVVMAELLTRMWSRYRRFHRAADEQRHGDTDHNTLVVLKERNFQHPVTSRLHRRETV